MAIAAVISFVGLILTLRATTAAVELAASQSEFVSTVTHEMKTPLSLIRLASKALATGRYDPAETTIADYGRLLDTEAARLSRLIDNVLCFARSTNAVATFSFERVDVAEVVQECVGRFKPELDSAELEVRTNLPTAGVEVRADRALMLQVFDNLIDNAVTHAASGRLLTITVESRDSAVHVTFADAGSGIAATDLPRVFDKFYRGSNARQRGTGLGLAIVQRIVRDHGGHITVQSTIGRGTTFEVVLPQLTEETLHDEDSSRTART
jgi:signal transduction histidine kinase